MTAGTAKKYGNGFSLIRGGQYPMRGRRRGRRTLTAAELVLDRDMHTAFVQLLTPTGQVPSIGVQRVREREQHPWRFLARRIIEAHATGVEHSKVRAILLAMLAWVDRLYATDVETTSERVFFQSPRRCA